MKIFRSLGLRLGAVLLICAAVPSVFWALAIFRLMPMVDLGLSPWWGLVPLAITTLCAFGASRLLRMAD